MEVSNDADPEEDTFEKSPQGCITSASHLHFNFLSTSHRNAITFPCPQHDSTCSPPAVHNLTPQTLSRRLNQQGRRYYGPVSRSELLESADCRCLQVTLPGCVSSCVLGATSSVDRVSPTLNQAGKDVPDRGAGTEVFRTLLIWSTGTPIDRPR